ncbi:MAG: hypothetical protein AAGI11_19805 [Pseudomonadota bacterium]
MSQSRKQLDTSELLGFMRTDREIDLQAPEIANRNGAKIGEPGPFAPEKPGKGATK